MKKLLLLLLCCLLLVACSSNKKTKEAESSSTTESSDSSEEYDEISWPTRGPGSLIPAPSGTLKGEVYDSSDSFYANIYGVDKATFDSFVSGCEEAGFTEDYIKDSESYIAYNADGYYLIAGYDKNKNMIDISIFAPSEESSESSEESTEESETSEPEAEESVEENSEPSEETEKSSAVSEDEIRPEVKEAIDSYEAWVDEYVEFLETYTNSDAVSQAKLLADYAEYMGKLVEWEEKMDALDENDLTDAETKYYIEVMNRCNTKLLEAAE